MDRIMGFVKITILGGISTPIAERLPRARVGRLSAPPAQALNCFMQWGIGSKELVAPPS